MQNSDKPGDHGRIRSDFPGGWTGDAGNGFTGQGLAREQEQMQEFLRRLLTFRKQNPALQKGALTHFAPQEGVYLLARSEGKQTVVVILNKNEAPVTLSLQRFEELGLNGARLRNVLTDETIRWSEQLGLESPGAYIFTTM